MVTSSTNDAKLQTGVFVAPEAWVGCGVLDCGVGDSPTCPIGGVGVKASAGWAGWVCCAAVRVITAWVKKAELSS